MENLISMTDFVLKLKLKKDVEFGALKELTSYYIRVDSYAELLKTPLDISMFVPCDDNNKPIENGVDLDYMDFGDLLFEGFEIKTDEDDSAGNKSVCCGPVHVYWWRIDSQTWVPSRGLKTIEDLTRYGLKLKQDKMFDDGEE